LARRMSADRIGVEEPLHAEPTHDTPADPLGKRGQGFPRRAGGRTGWRGATQGSRSGRVGVSWGGRAWRSQSGSRRMVIVRHEPPPQWGRQAHFQPGCLGPRLDPKPVPRRLLADRLPLPQGRFDIYRPAEYVFSEDRPSINVSAGPYTFFLPRRIVFVVFREKRNVFVIR